MQLPRFLWVPFELGRPFGAPNEPEFQRRVLRAALELLEREDGPVVLEDFPEDAPRQETEGEEAWACPVSFHPAAGDRPELVREVQEEIARLAPWHEIYVDRGGRPAPPACPLSRNEVVRALGVLAEGGLEPAVSTELALVEWVRLGCDDLRTWYLQAAQGQPARAAAGELEAWFWQETALARLIAGAAMTLARSANPGHQLFARRSMVPRTHMPKLMPGIEPSTGELPQRKEGPE